MTALYAAWFTVTILAILAFWRAEVLADRARRRAFDAEWAAVVEAIGGRPDVDDAGRWVL